MLIFVLFGCTTNDVKKPESQKGVPGAETLNYRIVYESEEGDLKVREAFLGSLETWKWEDFSMPQARIQNTVQDLGLRGACSTTAEFQASGQCIDTATIKTADNKEQRFDLICDHMIGGHCLLKRNGKLMWEGDLIAVTCGPVLSSKKAGDGIVIDYFNVVTPGKRSVDSILLTKGDSVIDIVGTSQNDGAFAPNVIQGKLMYFAYKYSANRQVLLVFDDQMIAAYDSIFN